MENNCPKCKSEAIYPDRNIWVCSECFNEWSSEKEEKAASAADNSDEVRDVNGQLLVKGDSVVVVKDLKIKGAASTIKSGTKIRNISPCDGYDGHNVSCKIDGIGSVNLKSEFLRKST